MRLLFLYLTILALTNTGLHAQVFNQDPGNPNMDFAAGNLDYWNIAWGPRSNPDSIPGAQPGVASHTLVNIYGTNWDGNAGTGNLARVPAGLERVTRLGAPSGGGYGSPKSYSMRYDIAVNSEYPVLWLRLASIMDLTHSGAENTHYRFSLRNNDGDYLLPQPCSGLELYPGAAPGGGNVTTIPSIGSLELPSIGGIMYQPWQSVAIDLSGFEGDTVRLEFEHFDCVSGFHGSYEYVAAGMRALTDTIFYCAEKDNIVLRPYLPDFKSYLWDDGSTGDTLLITAPGDGNVYSCEVTSYNGCTATFSFMTKAINTFADFTFRETGLCNQVSFTDISGTSGGQMSSRTWTFEGGGTDTSASPLFTFPGPGTYAVRLQVNTDDSCTAAITQNIVVGAGSAIASIGLPAPACMQDTLYFEDSAANSIARTWLLDGTVLEDTSRLLPFYFPEAGPHILTLIVASENGCPDTLQQRFEIHALPIAAIATFPATKSVSVTHPVLYLEGFEKGLERYEWYSSFHEETATTGDYASFTYPQKIDSYTVNLTAFNRFGCYDTASVTISVRPPEVYFPEAFSPNGDGINDVFRIINVTDQRIDDFSIFNRYGQRVFYAARPEDGWDGTFQGKACNTGTYYYQVVLTAPDGRKTKEKGSVTLIR